MTRPLMNAEAHIRLEWTNLGGLGATDYHNRIIRQHARAYFEVATSVPFLCLLGIA